MTTRPRPNGQKNRGHLPPLMYFICNAVCDICVIQLQEKRMLVLITEYLPYYDPYVYV